MEPAGVTLDEATVGKLSAANGNRVEFRDPSGRVIGYFLTPAQKAAMFGDQTAADVPHVVDEKAPARR